MRTKVGSNVNANATEIATLEELKTFIARLTTIFFHVSFLPKMTSKLPLYDRDMTVDDL